jgi:BlaI family transcriptional regulator, penicillinase repressor
MSSYMSPKQSRPTDSELEILTVLWSRGASTVREVYEILRKRRKTAEYSTTLKFMQIMAQKGLLKRDDTDRAHVYEPVHSREWMQQQLAGDLLQRGFDWSMKDLMIGALSARRASKEELAELRRLLDEYEKRKR